MITLLPYPSLRLSSHVLDVSTLARQRREAVHILKILAGRSAGLRRFELAVNLWRGFEPALCRYAQGCFDEMRLRGWSEDEPLPRSIEGAQQWSYPEEWATGEWVCPDWIGIERLHASHRAALLYQDPAWYAQFAWIEAPVVDYFWPGVLPIVGGSLWSESQGEALVLERIGDDYRCLLDGREITVTQDEVRRCQWRRVWR